MVAIMLIISQCIDILKRVVGNHCDKRGLKVKCAVHNPTIMKNQFNRTEQKCKRHILSSNIMYVLTLINARIKSTTSRKQKQISVERNLVTTQLRRENSKFQFTRISVCCSFLVSKCFFSPF